MRTNTIKFRKDIIVLENELKDIKSKANASNAQDSEAQYLYPIKQFEIFKVYTAYYIVKHCLVAKGTKDEYIKKVVNASYKALPGEWIKNKFAEAVNDLVTTYENINEETTNK